MGALKHQSIDYKGNNLLITDDILCTSKVSNGFYKIYRNDENDEIF